MIINKIEYSGLPDCLKISNGDIELVVTTVVGPRILRYALTGGENILGEHPEAVTTTALGEFKPYGGHRLWIAPENQPNSYAPDNAPVEFSIDENQNQIRLIQPLEPVTGTQKEIEIKVSDAGSGVEIRHKITNLNNQPIRLAPWALTIMRGGGECVIPNEEFASYSAETLLPVRSMALWSYTDFTDPRWSFLKNEIRLRTDENRQESQKVGVLNSQGWAAYEWRDLRFVKRFDVKENVVYPDFNSNVELYTAGSFVEVETLAPLQTLQTGEIAVHLERWELSEK